MCVFLFLFIIFIVAMFIMCMFFIPSVFLFFFFCAPFTLPSFTVQFKYCSSFSWFFHCSVGSGTLAVARASPLLFTNVKITQFFNLWCCRCTIFHSFSLEWFVAVFFCCHVIYELIAKKLQQRKTHTMLHLAHRRRDGGMEVCLRHV